MKIGIDARPAIRDSYSSMGSYTFSLIKFLQALDQANDYRLFWPDDEFKDLTPQKLELFNSMAKENNLYWEKVHLPNCIEKEKIDLIHLTQNGLGFPENKQCPVAITVHDLLPYFFPELLNKKDLKKTLDSMPRIMDEADIILTVSYALKNEIEELMGVPQTKIIVTYPAPEELYRTINKHKARSWVKENYGLAKDYILYAGGLDRGKNLKRLLIAFYQAQKDLSQPVQLVIAGNSSDEWEELTSLARALGIEEQVTFFEAIPPSELVWVYNAAQAFVYPSFYEGYPHRITQVMACGVPILASDIPANQEILGAGGLLVNPYDTLAIAEGIYNILENKKMAQTIAKEGLSRAGSFSWTKTALDTLAVYKDLWLNKI